VGEIKCSGICNPANIGIIPPESRENVAFGLLLENYFNFAQSTANLAYRTR